MSDVSGKIQEVTFEDGYERLKVIVGRLDDENVSVDEMCELFAEGKGLEKELRAYLEQQQGRLDEIEGGENLPHFRIVAPARTERTESDSEKPADVAFAPAASTSEFEAAAAGADDIPF